MSISSGLRRASDPRTQLYGGRAPTQGLARRTACASRRLGRLNSGKFVASQATKRSRSSARGAPHDVSARGSAANSLAVPAPFLEALSQQVLEQQPAKQLEPEPNVLRQLLMGYDAALKAYPVRTKALTSLVGFALGDYIAQGVLGGGIFDPTRCLRLSLYGLLLDGPVGHAWYRLLDSRVCPEDPTSTRAVLAKTAADQLLWAPAMTVVFFAFIKLLEGHPDQVLPTVQAMLVRTVVANYALWPAMHFLNFKFVPSDYRVLFNNVISVAWNAYLSWSCSGGDGGGGGLLAEPSGSLPQDDWPSAVPCAHRLPHAPSGLAALGVLQEARQTVGMDRILAAWGWQGFGDGEAGSQLASYYLETRIRVMQQVYGLPAAHAVPPQL